MPGLRRLQVGLALVVLVAAPASAVAAQRATIKVRVTGSCIGDTVSGRVTVRAPAGTRFTVRLMQQRYARSRWLLTKSARKFTSRGGRRTYPVQFSVSAFDAYAYRLAVYRANHRTLSRPIAATLCAPGEQVPEAPYSLLLPLSLLATASLLFVRRSARR